MSNVLGGPLLRQALQFLSGGLVSAGVVMADEVTTVVGAVSALLNVAWVVYARVTAK